MTEQTAETEKTASLEAFMLEQFARFAPTLSQYKWPWEQERWQWLVFCLMERIDDSADRAAVARETVDIFSKLGLLQIDALAQIAPETGEPDYRQGQLALMVEILARQGYGEEEAQTIVTSICEAARTWKHHYDGKVQRWLRKYGELMLANLAQTFSFSRLSREDVQFVFVHWLQDVANMPMILLHPHMRAFCEKLGISLDELVETADRNDINLALLDDWATDYMAGEPKEDKSEAK